LLALSLGGCEVKVQQLRLNDPRLPIEARRWLADSEDEVVIAKVGVNTAKLELTLLENYREILSTKGLFSGSKSSEASKLLQKYANERVALQKHNLLFAQKNLDLAKAKLTQARAETAIRYDVTVYEMQPIVAAVEVQRTLLIKAKKETENQRIKVETLATKLWTAYAKYVKIGGSTNTFWADVSMRTIRKD